MKKTNYSKIAHKYEENQYRRDEIKWDVDLKEYIDSNKKSEYHVLDLSCGTGLYLEKQMKYFDEYHINWSGIDLSEQMLKKAKEKAIDADLINADVEKMPYDQDTFDFISNNYAFHHYPNKVQAINEIYRVLKKGGIYKLHNIAIHDMPKWWVYHYFPAAYNEDLKRFWEKETVYNELDKNGFEVNLRLEYRKERIKVRDYLGYAMNRDISVLTLINDEEYEDGLKRMKTDMMNNQDTTIINDFAEVFFIAKKR